MFQLWAVRVDGGNGRERYGDDYADVYAISRIHYMATTNDTCDHVRLASFSLATLSIRTTNVGPSLHQYFKTTIQVEKQLQAFYRSGVEVSTHFPGSCTG